MPWGNSKPAVPRLDDHDTYELLFESFLQAS